MIKGFLTGCLFLILITMPLSAKDLGFFYAVKGDSVHIFLNQTLSIGNGFHVQRKLPGEDEFQRMTKEPVLAEMNPQMLPLRLGGFYDELLSALKLKSAEQLLVKLRTEDYYGIIATLMDRNAAAVLGRYFVAGDHQTGQSYEYRIIVVNRSGEKMMQAQQSVTITETYPEKVPALSAEQVENKVLLSWEYPQWSGKNSDIAFQFLLFRSDNDRLFTQVNDRPLFRLDGMPNRYIDETIVAGEKYTYKIVAVDAIDRTGQPAEAIIQTQDIVAPHRPMNLTTEVIDEKVHLTWQKNSEMDLQGYHVYRQEVNQPDTVRITPEVLPIIENAYVDSTMKYGVSYYYSITAIDKNGNESRHSNRMDALVTDQTPPLPPEKLHAKIINEQVVLTWKQSPSPDAIGYFVRRGYQPGKPYRLNEEAIHGFEYIDITKEKNKLTPGQKYYYSVVAVDTMTYKSQPVGIWVTIPDNDPPQPTGSIRVENIPPRGIRISWNQSISPDVSHYEISRTIEDNSEKLTTVGSDTLVYWDEDLVRGQEVLYFVIAMDTAGNESPKTYSGNIIFKDYSPPSAPAFLTAVLAENGVVINWEAAGDYDLAGYNIYRGSSRNAVGKKVNSALITQSPIIDDHGKKGDWYWVKSVDTSGNESDRSPAVQVK